MSQKPLIKACSTLVQKDYPEGYQLFMKSNGIKHIVIEIQGTKKVNIPLAVMSTVVEIALDDRNYPMLMHCNHGKVVQDAPSVSALSITYFHCSTEPAAWSLSFARLWDGASILSLKNTPPMHTPRLAIATSNISMGFKSGACLWSCETLHVILPLRLLFPLRFRERGW